MARSRLRTLIGVAASLVLIAAVAVAVTLSVRGPSGPEPYTGPTRDLYARPFAWDSVWNLPLATSAQYAPFATRASDIYLDLENISVDPSFPVREVRSRQSQTRVHVDPRLGADGSYNNCTTFLADTPDDQTVVSGQPLELRPGGDPSYRVSFPPVSLRGDGLPGCHGGSHLSGIGGTIRVGEMSAPAPLGHALKIDLNCPVSCSPTGGGFRWPATSADEKAQEEYRGRDPRVKMGTLMALPPDVDLAQFTEPDVRKIAEAMRDYGAYVVDATGGPPTNALNAQRGAEREIPHIDSAQMVKLFATLDIVTNSDRATPGGGPLGSPRRSID